MTTLNLAVAADADGASERQDGTLFGAGGTGTSVISSTAAGTRSIAGHRFTGVTIAVGSTINTCVCRVAATSTSFDDILGHIYLNDVDNAANFTDEADVQSRAKTTANTAWSATALGTSYVTTPGFAAALQEVIDRAGWASGNAVCVLFNGDNSATARTYQIEAYPNAGTEHPLLDIDYTAPAAASGNPWWGQRGGFWG